MALVFPNQSLFPLDARTHASCKSEAHLQITPSICSQLEVCELSYLDHDFVASVMDDVLVDGGADRITLPTLNATKYLVA